jgi:hypothetical protein
LLKRGTLREALPLLFLIVFFGLLFFQLLSTHMLAQKADGLYSGGSTWGDLAWHLSMISNFAQRGSAAVRENPIFPGSKLSYPFVPDLISAWLVRSGVSLRLSLILPALLTLLGLVVAIYVLARSVGANALGSVLSVFLVLFNGTIFGILYLWGDYRNASNLGMPFSVARNDYAHIPAHNLQFSNFICDLLLPQRAADFGFCIGTIVIILLWDYWKRSSRKSLFYAGLLLSCLPLIHFHTFVALGMVAGFLSLIQLSVERSAWRNTVEAWSLFALPMVIVALPQMLWILPGHAGHFLRLQFGWMKGNDSLLWFWLKNLSPHIFVFAVAFWFASQKVKTFYLAFVGLFLLSNLVVFQPHDYDNLKLMFWWFLMSCVLTGVMLDFSTPKSRPLGFLLSFILVVTMIATGSVSVWRELHLSIRMFSSEDIALAQYVKDHTSTDAIFLTSDKHNNPIACLAGRRIVMGYRGWLWTHGLDYRVREHDVIEMFRGSEQAIHLLGQYGVGYVLIEEGQIQEFHEDPEFFTSHFPVVYRTPNYTLLTISVAGSSGRATPNSEGDD